ncbi:DszA family Xenobiotic compound monooxygenase [Colletotrichum costaricense]|uniref:DszA family Xenobiotic compound monooxygenase n=1 Tax=Colletotrichum costaricense TaxID=1209916 RepID=A0AAI9YT42_9PEZI|nr:DszA family Xenobiotic compound monooxygenase [Colletotrichum costaricense]KAK1522574.1 DszA family Xenobiotic compound monooxygenase [Colletotrichum costaricense]
MEILLSSADGKLTTDAAPAHFRQRVGLSAARAYPAKMEPSARRQIILNAFDMFTPSHLCFGQWRRGEDEVADKFRDLSYWTNLAQTLERGDIHALILADTYGQHDIYNGSAEPTIRTSCQFPMGDPVIAPFVVAKRFSTLDHLTKGRFGWNIVTSFKESAAKAVGVSYVEHDDRYAAADEYLELLYNAGIAFAAKHAEGIMISGLSPHILAPRVAAIRQQAAEAGRDPGSVKIFAVITPVIARTDEEATAKYRKALEFANFEAGLAFFSGNAGIDLAKYDLDAEIRPDDATIDGRVHSMVSSLKYRGDDIPVWTPRNIGKVMAIGGNGPVLVGSAARVADFFEEWVKIADLDGFSVGHVTTPGSFEDVVDLLVPELRGRGLYGYDGLSGDGVTLRERMYGVGQKHLRHDHIGGQYKYKSWATFGYFVRLLDSSNITNAYVSGMKEDLDFQGNEYNLLQTFFTCGYLVGQIPSQFLLTRSMRFLLGFLESPFAVGVLTIMGSWYTPRELSKRISIFYSASYAASMFSGYLQAAIYRGLNGAGGLPGWRWLFIFCGIISIWAPIWGFFAVPDNPHITRARWMRPGEQAKHIARMEAIDRRKPEPLTNARVLGIFTNWPIYVFSFALICHCVVTQPLNYFSVWLKSLNRFTVYQINLFPTAAQAHPDLADKTQTINLIGMIMVAVESSYATTFVGYVINAASWGFWPAWAIEIMHKNMEERAIVIGVAQTLGQAFIAWVPGLQLSCPQYLEKTLIVAVVILDVGKYAPSFHMGFSVMCGVSVLELSSIFIIRHFEKREKAKNEQSILSN